MHRLLICSAVLVTFTASADNRNPPMTQDSSDTLNQTYGTLNTTSTEREKVKAYNRKGRSKKILVVPSQSKFGFPKFYLTSMKSKLNGGSGGWGMNNGGGWGGNNGGGWMGGSANSGSTGWNLVNNGGMGWGLGGGWINGGNSVGGWTSMMGGNSGMGWGTGTSGNGWGGDTWGTGTGGGQAGFGGSGWGEESGEWENNGGCVDKKAQKAIKKAQKKKAKAQKKAQKKGVGTGFGGWNGANNGGGWNSGTGNEHVGEEAWKSEYLDSDISSTNSVSGNEDVLDESQEVWPNSLPRTGRITSLGETMKLPEENKIYSLELEPHPFLMNFEKKTYEGQRSGNHQTSNLPSSGSKAKKIRSVDALKNILMNKNSPSVALLKPSYVFAENTPLRLACLKGSWFFSSPSACKYVRSRLV